MSNLTIGYVYDKYFTRRNVIGLASDCNYIAVSDRYKYLQRAALVVNKLVRANWLNQHDLANQFQDGPSAKHVNVLHLFNQISYGRKPWVVTFETTVPRYRRLLNCHHGREPSFTVVADDRAVQKAMAALAGKACKKVIALSECTRRIESSLSAQFPATHDAICAKTTVQQPPQAKLIESIDDKETPAARDIRFLFVGASFFRKGGREIIETFQELKREHGYPLQLTIVSTLTIDSYAAQETPADQQRARQLIDANRDWINYHNRLDNRSVLQLMRETDVGLLPTYADTYGYSVLEFQAAGCPVITTDVRAMPEINDDTRGWLIAVPKNSLGEAIYTTTADREQISRAIRTGLKRCLHEIIANRSIITAKAARALRGIADHHDPARVGERLKAIYLDALS